MFWKAHRHPEQAKLKWNSCDPEEMIWDGLTQTESGESIWMTGAKWCLTADHLESSFVCHLCQHGNNLGGGFGEREREERELGDAFMKKHDKTNQWTWFWTYTVQPFVNRPFLLKPSWNVNNVTKTWSVKFRQTSTYKCSVVRQKINQCKSANLTALTRFAGFLTVK